MNYLTGKVPGWLWSLLCILDTFVCGPRGHWGFNWRFGSSLEERGRWKELSGVLYWLLELHVDLGNYDQVNTHTGLPVSENVHLDAKRQALHVTYHWFTKRTNMTMKILHPLRFTLIVCVLFLTYHRALRSRFGQLFLYLKCYLKQTKNKNTF